MTPARKLSHQGRTSGGVIVLVKNTLWPFVKQVQTDFDNVIIFEASKNLLGTDSNVFLVCTYLNPVNSPVYNVSTFGDGMSMLEECLLGILGKNMIMYYLFCAVPLTLEPQEMRRAILT